VCFGGNAVQEFDKAMREKYKYTWEQMFVGRQAQGWAF
jgi:hypothetical protein